MRSRPRIPLLLLAALALLTAPTAMAKTPKTAPAAPPTPGATEHGGQFYESVDVNVVNVDVFVTQKDGKPVNGLTKDDFEVIEDGRPMTISNFYSVEQEEPVMRAAPRLPPPPGAPDEETTTAVPDDQRLFLVVYIDNFNIHPFSRNRVFRQIREFLDRNVGSEDKVMLVTYDRELHERIGFTSDPGVVSSALFDLEKITGSAVHQDSDRRDTLD